MIRQFQSRLTRLLVLCAALSFVPVGGCAVYRAEAIEGWIIDAETEKPIEGVVIVAHWAVDDPYRISGKSSEVVQLFETTTDRDGRYFFPAWGPKWITSPGIMRAKSPVIWLFKPGYRASAYDNIYYSRDEYGTSKFLYNKERLKIERFKGSLSEYEKTFSSLNSGLRAAGLDGGAPCGWKTFPRMLRAIDNQYAEFRRIGINTSNVVEYLRTNNSFLIAANCGSIDDVLKP